MDGIDYETTGPMWDQPCRVGRFVGTREYAFGSWSAIDTVVAWEISKPWACRHPREVASRCGVLIQGRTYRWLFHKTTGDLVGWREEPLPKADTVSKHKCEMCGAETENSYQDMAKVCNGCAVEFHNTVWACLHVAKAMYGDKARVKLYRGDPGNIWKINVVNESRANTGIMGKNDGKRVRDAFEALCQEAVSPCFPHPDDGPLEARLDAIGEAAMRLGAGVYGAADR